MTRGERERPYTILMNRADVDACLESRSRIFLLRSGGVGAHDLCGDANVVIALTVVVEQYPAVVDY